MDDLFVSAFKALIQLGGSGWLLAGIELLGIIYLYRENNRTRDRAEAIGERTVIALERVTAVNRDVATTLEGSINSREELVRLVSEIARRGDDQGKRSNEDIATLAAIIRTIETNTKDVSRCFDRVYSGQDGISTQLHTYQIDVARAAGVTPPNDPPPFHPQRRIGSSGGGA